MSAQWVSTIIPACNAAVTIREAIDSALAQTLQNQEIIVVNDGSTDETQRILDDYGSAICVVAQANAGRAAASNAGARAASGQYVAFRDADDILMPNELQYQTEECSAYAMCYTHSVFFSERLDSELVRTEIIPHFSGHVLDKLILGNSITGSSVMVGRDVLRTVGGFDETCQAVQDWPLRHKSALPGQSSVGELV